MRELETEYAGKVEFKVDPVSTPGAMETLSEHDLGSHGLLAKNAAGEPSGTLPGHSFTKDDIVRLIDAMLQ